MRSIFLGILIFVLVGMAHATPSFDLDRDHSDKECLIPFEKLRFAPEDAFNEFENSSKFLQGNDSPRREDYQVLDAYRYRYVVGDFNTIEEKENGSLGCRGIQEIYPQLDRIEELSDSQTLQHFQSQVQRFAKTPINKSPIVSFNGLRYCIGQRVLVCDLKASSRGRRVAKLIARFIASSAKAGGNIDGIDDGYYAPMNYIAQRGWDERAYTESDRQRDYFTGGSKGGATTIYKGSVPMPNFMYFRGDRNLDYGDGNGLHEKTVAEGQALRDFMGSPISKGCIRLEDYAAKFIRWYIPRGAKFFIYYKSDYYRRAPL